MALILCIDTSLNEAAVCITENGEVLAREENESPADHAGWLTKTIRGMLLRTGRNIRDISAIAVTEGPGSYTGLRVGMATAKGMCYALQVPLITESTLILLGKRVKNQMTPDVAHPLPMLICPMIDARRMEVFTMLLDPQLNERLQPGAMILNENSFSEELAAHVILFCGNGSKKWQHLCIHSNAVFVDAAADIADLADSATAKFNQKAFSNLAYAEPAYLKKVYTGKQVD